MVLKRIKKWWKRSTCQHSCYVSTNEGPFYCRDCGEEMRVEAIYDLVDKLKDRGRDWK